MGFDHHGKNRGESSYEKEKQQEEQDGEGEKLTRHMSVDDIPDDDENSNSLHLGPQYTLREQIEKDKRNATRNRDYDSDKRHGSGSHRWGPHDDESLRRWKEQLLGSVDFDNVGESLDPEVKFLQLSIQSYGIPDIVLSIPGDGNPKGLWFTLKEGSRYNLKFTFKVSNNIVSGLKYTNTVWKTGIKVDSTKEMIGTFSPQPEHYTHVMPEDTTPSGMFARGSYSARSKFLDDDNKCYLEINYTFDIRKGWATT